MLKNIGWIGTGVMGQSMAGHLIKKGGFKLNVFNRTASKADSLVAQGAVFMPAKQIAMEADYLFLMLGYPHDVQDMVLHPDTGICKYMKKGSYLIDHTTSTPSLAKEIAEHALKFCVHSIDAPVSGGDIGAKNGTLVTMCGGAKQDVEHVKPLLDLYSTQVEHMGDAGAGQHTKAAN